jgi:hypothetical protein
MLRESSRGTGRCTSTSSKRCDVTITIDAPSPLSSRVRRGTGQRGVGAQGLVA